jgi:hypothetical protein
MWLNAAMEQPRNRPRNDARWDVDKVRFHLDQKPAPQRDIRGLDEVLKDVVTSLGQPVQDNVLLLRKAWPDLAGDQIATYSEPGFIKDFTLTVFVNHPGWLPELERIKRTLLQKLQSEYRDMRIRKLNFSLNQH